MYNKQCDVSLISNIQQHKDDLALVNKDLVGFPHKFDFNCLGFCDEVWAQCIN